LKDGQVPHLRSLKIKSSAVHLNKENFQIVKA
jgi:hypothetical protein